MVRSLTRVLAIGVIVVIAFVVLQFGELLVPAAARGAYDMAPTIPGCNGRILGEGFTYKLRDPERGEVVAIHAAGQLGGEIIPDRDARDLVLTLRVAGEPGDVVVARDGLVYVNDVKFDDIPTEDFGPVTLRGGQYFVLGDNRGVAVDSREFGPILRNAIFARVLLVIWPWRDIGPPYGRESGPSPGRIDCT